MDFVDTQLLPPFPFSNSVDVRVLLISATVCGPSRTSDMDSVMTTGLPPVVSRPQERLEERDFVSFGQISRIPVVGPV